MSARREVRSINEAILVSPILKAAYAAGLSMEEIVVVLVNQNTALLDECARLEWMCPKKYRLHDGRVFVWHLPDELVPESEVTPRA